MDVVSSCIWRKKTEDQGQGEGESEGESEGEGEGGEGEGGVELGCGREGDVEKKMEEEGG